MSGTQMQKCYIIKEKKRKTKKIIALLDDEAIVHCSMANSVQVPEKADSRQER